jgi:DNA-binding MarR family transcriptional regulator
VRIAISRLFSPALRDVGMLELDKADLKILAEAAAWPGSIETYFLENLEDDLELRITALRRRLYRLETLGLVHLDRSTRRGRVFVFITNAGEQTLMGCKGETPDKAKEVSP